MHRRRNGVLLIGLFLLAAVLSEAHVVLDGEIVQAILLDIARYLKETSEGRTEDAKLEALYLLGEKAQYLTELISLDLMSHGKSLYADLIVKRLHEYGIRITRVQGNMRFVYDMAAFREYLKRSPQGKRASDSEFRLIAKAFYGSIGKDPADLVDVDVDGLRNAILPKEAFVKQYPGHEKAKEVRFFLAMDYYRLYKNSPDPATARKYEKLSAQALQEILKKYPGTAEARSAEITLERFQGAGQKN